MKTLAKAALKVAGYKLAPLNEATSPRELNPDITDSEWETFKAVEPYTMTTMERVLAAIRATEYIFKNNIPGDIVECGVWRGGSSMAIARTLAQLGDTSRKMYLFDTFEGMTKPTQADTDTRGKAALDRWIQSENGWCAATLDDVRANLAKTKYPEHQMVYVKGPVEQTIPGTCPDSIALLRLDTDWYESTKHELTNLYHRLSPGGVLIIDDYGHWEGARKAVDEFFCGQLFLSRIDYTGRIAIKPKN